ncbi:inositol hexakisphosphate and diphosphoinositol-pentakisphosphate kinase isoform X4 [Onthophagus taurus]|uniref:inositol hexakisphosphate and diphosphoinositol-pentakisphosphate kinase isoform X4 n=1 Tax=Onthophagus taurus TaxID=166361 RepID=UPI0039BE187D
MEWPWLKYWWRLKKFMKSDTEDVCFCDDCYGDLECDSSDNSLGPPDMEETGKQVLVGVCAMAKKSQSKPMKEILTRLQEFEYIKVIVFPEEKPVEEWPSCDCLISFHSKGFPLEKAVQYARLHNPYVINNLHMQYDIQDRRKVYSILESEGIEIPRYAVLDRDSPDPKHHELVESEDHVEVNGVVFNKPFVEKPVSAEDHNIYIYYPTSAGGGSQRLFRKIGSRSSVYSPESRVRKTGSFIYEDFMPTDGTDVKVYTVGPDYAHAEARKSPALDGKVERDRDGKEIRYPVILSNAEKLISRKVCLAFKQAVCGFDLLRANGKSFVCDVNGFSFVKNSNKYYDDCAKILGNMILRELAPTLHIPWSVPFQLDDPPIVPTTFGKMMELRCVVAVIRHGDRTPKQKMKVEVRHQKFFEIFEKYDGYKHGHVKLKRPKQLQEILDIARSLLAEIQQHEADPEIEEKQGKLEQLKSVLEMYGHFSGINRKVQMKYQPKGRPRGSSSDDGKASASSSSSVSVDKPAEPSLVLILKWGGELTPAGRIQAEELGKIFRCMYPGGQGRHLAGEYAGAQGLGLLRLHSTFRHDLKIYASDEGRVQMTAAAFAKGLLALEGELTPILVQMVKSANTNGLLDNDCDSSKYQNMCKSRLHELMQLDREFSQEDKEKVNPGNSRSINDALEFVKNPVKCCKRVHDLIKSLMEIVRQKKEDPKTKDAVLYHAETWELMGRRWGKIEKDFFTKNKIYDISKIPDIYDCIKYDLQHNQHTLQFEQAEELYINAKYLADIVIPQEYGLTVQEKLTIGQGICTPLLKKIKADLQRNIEESEENVNRLNPVYSHGVSSPGRHVRTRLYFTSESHIHSLITVLRHGGLLDVKKDEQWRRAMEYISMVSELNYMSQIVIMLYEDPTKDPSSEERFHIELHFSPGVNCCVQKNLPPGPGFRPHSRNESVASKNNSSTNTSDTATPDDPKSHCSPRIEEEAESTPEEDNKSDFLRPLHSEPSTSASLISSDVLDHHNQYYKHKTSDPIPIGNSHTVCGHEAMHLAQRLHEELEHQTQRGGRAASPDPEPRSRSYDSKQNKGKEQLHQFQSLDAVNSQQEDDNSPNNDNDPITPTNVPTSPPIYIPRSELTMTRFKLTQLSPISGSFDHVGEHGVEDDSPFRGRSLKNSPLVSKHGSFDDDNDCSNLVVSSKGGNEKMNSTNELPLTELNLKLFTSEQSQYRGVKMSTNELPLSDIHFKRSFDIPDDTSLEVNWESENSEVGSTKENKEIEYHESRNDREFCDFHDLEFRPQHRSYSDPNILETEKMHKYYLIEKYNQFFDDEKQLLSVTEPPPIPFSSFDCIPHDLLPLTSSYYFARTPSTLLSFFSAPPKTTARSLSHPTTSRSLTGPSVSDSDSGGGGCSASGGGAAATATNAKRHRHSIAGQMSYFKMLGFGLGGGPAAFKKLAGGANQNSTLFSTAVITGSSSAPNLRDMIPSTASATGIEGFGGVPPIRPLETLHNALSLKQLDNFLEKMTTAPLYKTPSSTPPKYPSTPLPTPTNSIIAGCPGSGHPPLRLQSPSSSWSGPPSFISSSSGPSSPGISDIYSNSKESSEMSSSVISGDGLNVNSISHMFPTAPGLDQDLENVGILLENAQKDDGNEKGLEFVEYFTNIQVRQDESGDVTPVSGGSEIEFNTNDATAGSTADCDVTVTEEIESSLVLNEDEDFDLTKSVYSPTSSSTDVFSPILSSPQDNKILVITERRQSDSKYPLKPGSDKWAHSKEKFLANSNSQKLENLNYKSQGGMILVKESFIEPPKINRISRSFHGQTNSVFLDVGATSPRRASDSNNDLKKSPRRNSNIEKSNSGVKQLLTQKSLSENKNVRFVTTKVDEAEHAASVGIHSEGANNTK